MKKILFILSAILFATAGISQKKVDASVDLVSKSKDSINLGKGKTVVVMLPVKNRAGDDWQLSPVPAKLKFTESFLGQAGMLPNQEEPKLFFFKAASTGADSIRFLYKNPKAGPDALPEYRVLYVHIK